MIDGQVLVAYQLAVHQIQGAAGQRSCVFPADFRRLGVIQDNLCGEIRHFFVGSGLRRQRLASQGEHHHQAKHETSCAPLHVTCFLLLFVFVLHFL